jgi:hypothetical protein
MEASELLIDAMFKPEFLNVMPHRDGELGNRLELPGAARLRGETPRRCARQDGWAARGLRVARAAFGGRNMRNEDGHGTNHHEHTEGLGKQPAKGPHDARKQAPRRDRHAAFG